MSVPDTDLRPLIGVEEAKANCKVLVVFGREAREWAAKRLHGMMVVTWMGSVSGTDWEPLRRRAVDIWTDAGGGGRRYAAAIAGRLLKMGCKVRALDTTGLGPPAGAWLAMEEDWPITKIREHTAPRWREITVPPPIPKGPIGVVTEPRSEPEPEPPAPPAGPKSPTDLSALEFYDAAGIDARGGKPVSNASNIFLGLKAMNRLFNLGIAYDEFLKQIVWREPRVRFEDTDLVTLQCELQGKWLITKATHADVKNCVMAIARENVVNEAKDWLGSLKWDGEERLPHLMSEGFGATHDEYSAAVGRCFMMSMVKRVLEPGCQQDYVLVLESEQGQRKTTALSIIGGKWFTETHEEFGSLEFLIAIQGKVLVNIGELSAFKGARLEKVKGIITRRVDTFRSKYGVWANDHPRIACFVGDTNESNYLNDPTGGRRYWPVRTSAIDTEWLSNQRENLWAEAVARVERGERYWDVPERQAEQEQEARREILPWEEKILKWLQVYGDTELSIVDVIRMLEVSPRDETNAAKVIAPILRRSGWKRMQKWVGKSRVYVYRRVAEPQASLGLSAGEGAALQ